MKKTNTICIFIASLMICLVVLSGCDRVENKFTSVDFKNKMLDRGYEYTFLNDGFVDNLIGDNCELVILNDNIIVDGYQYILYDVQLYIYYYKDNKEMEIAASKINEDASMITIRGTPKEIKWRKNPHFYKKGTVIVLYDGNDEKIINDLTYIMGEQFAGK